MRSWGKSVSGNRAAHGGAGTLKSYTPPHVQAAPVSVVNTGWRLAFVGLAWPLGAALQLQERSLQAPGAYVLMGVIGALAIAVALRWPRGWFAAVLGLALLAFALTGGRASMRQGELLGAALEGRDVRITGVVASLPQRGVSGQRFQFDVEQAMLDDQGVALPPRISVGWYQGFQGEAAPSELQRELRAGQRWQFTVRVRRPHGLLNPHGFDLELQSFEQGVGASASVREALPPLLIERAAAHPVERWRQRVRDAIDAQVSDARAAGVLAALAVGDQSAIDRDDWDLFRRTGIAHLVSISGLHVTMFAWCAGAIVGRLWRRSVRAMLWLPAPTAALWGGVVAAAGYAVLSGWGVPAQRTVWMLATVAALRSAGLRWPWPLVLLAAASVVTLLDPWALQQPGFWLSFAAVGLLMVSSPTAHGREAADPLTPVLRLCRVIGEGLRTQLIATIGLAPLTLVFFQQISLVGFAANLIAIPLVTLVITPLALLGTLVPVLWTVGAWCVAMLVGLLGWLAQAPVAVWSVGVAPWWAQLSALLGAALLVMPLPWRVRLSALPLVLPLLLPPRDLPGPGQFELVAADVGQGTAVIVRTRSHVLLYDSGPRYSPESDAGQRVLLPLLRARGDERIDRLVLSHRDTDHIGGAPALLAQWPVGDLLSSLEPQHPLLLEAQQRAVSAPRCEAGQRWEWDGVRFEVLHPAPEVYESAPKPNTLSCVLRVQGVGMSALLTGDIERDQEIRLLREHPDALRADVLLAPHHGSKTSSSAAFLDVVHPHVAVFQAGHHNRYGHPADEVLERYRERGIERVDSPHCGAWVWRSDAPAASGRCTRESNHRYWHWRDPGAP
ncbi:MAG: DNA internalization-related competence protein ComEC/Rec2 [Burkholderiales bacterium 28-67-8]|nr:MAG: DNA internalization-related competence protein ComEC/Rec2 [Burkholderiales bacterium 28-67-8]